MEYVYENEDLLQMVETDRSIISDNAFSFTESTLYIAEAVEKEYNKLFTNIGIEELAVYESTGSQIVYEGTKLQNFKDGVIKFFQGIWARIKGLFEKVTGKIKEIVNANKSKFKVKLTAKINSLPEGKEYGTAHEFPAMGKMIYGVNARKFAETVQSEFEKLSADKEVGSQEIIELRDQFNKEVCGMIISSKDANDISNVEEMKERIAKEIKGNKVKVDKKYLQAHCRDIEETVLDFTKAVKNYKDLYKECRGVIDKSISIVKGYRDEKMNTAAACVSVLKNINLALCSVSGAVGDCIKTKQNEYRNLMVRCILATKDKTEKEEEATTESVIAKQVDLIESAFTW